MHFYRDFSCTSDARSNGIILFSRYFVLCLNRYNDFPCLCSLLGLLSSRADIFNRFPVVRKCIPSCALTNNTKIIFTPMKPGLSPTSPDFEKKTKQKSIGLVQAPEPWLIPCYTNTVLSLMMFGKCLWICLCNQPQRRSVSHLKTLSGRRWVGGACTESCLQREIWNIP